MTETIRYSSDHAVAWDRWIDQSKNGVFLFRRDYMEYHSDRYDDYSILFHDDSGNLIGVLPATRSGDTVISHGGLTFGGLILSDAARVSAVIAMLDALIDRLRNDGVARLLYKAIPHIYHRVPAEEDLYALFRNGARLYRRDASSAILMDTRRRLSKSRRWGAGRARRSGVRVDRSTDFEAFMDIERDVLGRRYGVEPVHTAEELHRLATRFPECIKLFAASKGGAMVGGVVIYESSHVAHTQYIGATADGRSTNALDLVFEYLLEDYYVDKRYFDFGKSTEGDGRLLNEGLISYKQHYGGRVVVYDFYELTVGPDQTLAGR